MSAYSVTITREGPWWVVDCGDLGSTQGRNLTEAREMGADLISIMTETDVSPDDLDVTVSMGEPYSGLVARARNAVAHLAELQQETAQQSRAAAAALVNEAGLSGRDAAIVLGISPQRVSQLLADSDAPAPKAKRAAKVKKPAKRSTDAVTVVPLKRRRAAASMPPTQKPAVEKPAARRPAAAAAKRVTSGTAKSRLGSTRA